MTVRKDACTCDYISIKDKNDKFVGGPDCMSKDDIGHNYCFVGKETALICNEIKNEGNYETEIDNYDTESFDKDWIYDLFYYDENALDSPDFLPNSILQRGKTIWYPIED